MNINNELMIILKRNNHKEIYDCKVNLTKMRNEKFCIVEEIKSTKRNLNRIFRERKSNKAENNQNFNSYIKTLNERLFDYRGRLIINERKLLDLKIKLKQLKLICEALEL